MNSTQIGVFEMTTVKDLIKQYNVPIELEEYILEENIGETYGIDLENINEYKEETNNDEKIYIFKGSFDDNSYFEFIINPDDKEENGITLTYRGYHNGEYDVTESFTQQVFYKDGIVKVNMM